MKKIYKIKKEIDTDKTAVFKLTNGEYLFKDCGGVLFLDNNNITMIKNIPKGVGILFLDNNNITTIKNIPKGVERLSLDNNNITTIKNIPKGVRILSLDNNNITMITKKAKIIIKKNNTKVYGINIDKLKVI